MGLSLDLAILLKTVFTVAKRIFSAVR
jgi:hypothetical protein